MKKKDITNDDLALMKKGFDGIDSQLSKLHKDMNTRFTKIANQLQSVENYKVTQLQIIKILREKKIPRQARRRSTWRYLAVYARPHEPSWRGAPTLLEG